MSITNLLDTKKTNSRPENVGQLSSGDVQNIRRVIFLIILLHLCITIPLAAKLNIWIDEGYTLDTTGQDTAYAIRQAIQFEFQPPLYFVALNAWRHLGDSIFVSRLFSILCVVAMLMVTGTISRRFFPDLHPAWPVLLVASNPFVIWAAVEIRVYALGLLFSALLILYFYDGFFSNPINQRARQLYILFGILGLYTMYYLGFLLAFNAIILLLARRWHALRAYLLGMFGVALVFGPLLWFLKIQVTEQDIIYVTEKRDFFESFLAIARQIQWFIFSYWPKDHVFWPFWNLLIKPLMVIGAIFVVIKNRRRIGFQHTYFGLICCFGFLTFFSLRFFSDMQYAFGFRHTSVVLFLPLILLVVSIHTLLNESRKFTLPLFAASLLLSYSITLTEEYNSMSKPGDWKRVADQIMSEEAQDQKIIVFPPDMTLPLSSYYSGDNIVVSIPRELDVENYDPREFVLKDVETVCRLLTREEAGNGVWLVTVPGDGSFLAHSLNSQALETAVEGSFEVESRYDFQSSTVRLLRSRVSNPADPRNTEE